MAAPMDPEEFRKQLLSLTPAQVRRAQQLYDPGLWALETARISLPKNKFSFEGRGFIREVYRDISDEVIVIKGAQMGFSVMSIIRALWASTTFPLSVIYCVDETTELLSRRGWLKWNEVEVGEDILTFDRETSTTRWSPVEELFVERNYVGPMVHMTSTHFDALVTPNHRWFVKPLHGTKWREYETKDLPKFQRIPLRGTHADFVQEPEFSDDYVELAAWVITEGHYRHYYDGEETIIITQSATRNPANVERIRQLATRLDLRSKNGGPFRDRVEGTNWRLFFGDKWAQRLREDFPTKELTPDFVTRLTQAQTLLLIETMLDGDGDRSGREMFHQKSRQTSDAFAMAVVLSGRGVSFRDRERDGFTWQEVRVRKDAWAQTEKLAYTTIDISGLVWCPRTRDGTAFFRRNGRAFFSCQTFPTQGDVSNFTAARINPMISSSPYLKDRIQDIDSVSMKQFARVPREMQKRLASAGQPISFSTVYFKGAQNPKDATSVDADLLIHDEEDRSDPQTIEEYQSRLFASSYKWMIRLSTPTYPGQGIDRQWRRSDMRHWLIRCPGCNYEFEMDFPQNIEPSHFLETPEGGRVGGTPARYKCHRCNRTIDEQSRQDGRWVAERPNIAVHGYSISQMSASWVPAVKILEQEFKATFKGAFWNLVMARPYQEGTNAMDEAAIMARQDESVVGMGQVRYRMENGSNGIPCTMGVDVGKYLDIVIGTTELGRPRTIEFKRLEGITKWDDLGQLMTSYNVLNCVIDSQPEDHMAHVFADAFSGRVWRARYSDGRVKEMKWDEKSKSVMVPRTEILTRSSDELLTKRILPKFDGTDVYKDFIKHHENSKKVPIFRGIESVDTSAEDTVERERMVEKYEWRETGPDHFFHAGTYEMMARMGYETVAELPSVGLVTINRFKLGTKEMGAPPKTTLPLLLPSSTRRVRRRW